MRFNRLFRRYQFAMLVAAIGMAAFYLGRVTTIHTWAVVFVLSCWVVNLLLVGIRVWRVHKSEKREFRDLMHKQLELEMRSDHIPQFECGAARTRQVGPGKYEVEFELLIDGDPVGMVRCEFWEP